MENNHPYSLIVQDVERGAAVLSSAFLNYPAFKYLFPDLIERSRKLKYVMSFFIRCGLLQGNVIAPSKNIESILIWYKAKDLNFSLKSLTEQGLIKLICNLNISSFSRLKKLGDAKKKNRNDLLGKDDYLLDLIGTDPQFEKKGYAKFLINYIIEKASKEKVNCFLETSKSENIDYYKKYGFNLLSSYNYDGLVSYCLNRNFCKEVL